MSFIKNKRRRNYLRKRLSLLILGAVAVLIFTTGAAASGSGATRGAQWIVDFDFSQGTIDAQLLIETGFIDHNGELVNVTQHPPIPIECEEVGQIIYHSDAIEFDGMGYLACKLPSIQEHVADLTNGELLLQSHCTCKNPWFTGDVWISPNATWTSSAELQGRSLFYHPDFELSTAVSNNQTTAAMQLTVDNTPFWSSDFVLESSTTPFEASLKQGFGGFYTPFFSYDTHPLAAYGTVTRPLEISTEAETIYIGHRPGGPNFVGILRSLKGDPPCLGGSI